MNESTPISNNPLASLLPPTGDAHDSWRWATVTSTTPLQIHIDGDDEPLITTPDTLTPVNHGDRVRVHIHHRRTTIIGTATPHDNTIAVRGIYYPASGTQPLPTFTWTSSANNWYGTTITMPAPFVPPIGYGFAYSMLEGNGFTIVTTASPTKTVSEDTTTDIRLLNFNHASPRLRRVQWQLVKQN
jgi:hypothetical protein